MVEDGFNQLNELEQARYTTISKKKHLELAAEMMNNDYERLKRIGFGEESADPSFAQVAFNAVNIRARAEGDMDTQIRLAESPIGKVLSEAAQVMASKGFNSISKENDPVEAMQDITEIRKKEASKKINVKKEIKSSVKNIKDMTKQELRKLDWDSFVKSIEC